MRREVAYLLIPVEYFGGSSHGPRWSAAGDAIEWPDESTLVFAGQVALFLEGYTLFGPPIHFAHVVQIFQLFDLQVVRSLDTRPTDLDPRSPPVRMIHPAVLALAKEAEKLIRAFLAEGRPMRNLGALSAYLCRDVPPLADPPRIADLCGWLNDGSLLSSLSVQVAATSSLASEVEAPAISMIEFAARFLLAVRGLDGAAIVSWLRHGRGAVESHGDRLAAAIEANRPRSLEGALATLAARDRLAGSIPMVGPLVGALALPPRRLAHRALPTGGYADVGTRGRPEQILPSQFALDGDEFLRRFAENELLYFHREEPHAPLTEELILLIDQGVRTWGRVRVALAAAALALGKLAARRGLPLLVGSTGSGGKLLDPATAEAEALGRLWEACDLTVDPGLALEAILREKGDGARDVVVLSHPRSLVAADFASATRTAAAGVRIFSVAVDEPGRVEFREWHRGVSAKLGEFRVDWSPPSAPPSRPQANDPRAWKGDVEPVGFPFRFGVLHRLDRPLFDLDYSGRWLLLATSRGILHGWALDGSRSEILPRGIVEGEVLDQVDAVLGVAGGFVVAGRIGKRMAAIHYELRPRTAKAHAFGPTLDQGWEWLYDRDRHTVVARGRDYSRSINLSTGETRRDRDQKEGLDDPAVEVGPSPAVSPRLAIVDEKQREPREGRSIRLDSLSGEVRLGGVSRVWEPFTPVSDGLPSLRGCFLEEAQLRGGVLALLLDQPDRTGQKLRLFHGPTGLAGRELTPASPEPGGFMLSPDGRLIARRVGERAVEVRETTGNGQPVFLTPKGKVHTDLTLTLGRYGMIVRAGRFGHLIRWDAGRLDVTLLPEGFPRLGRDAIPWPIDRPASRRTSRPPILDYDPRRFLACARSELTAVIDAFGQVILFDRRERLLAIFLAFRNQVAAWMPDGTRFGPAHLPSPLIEGPPTPGAAGIIGRTLKAASEEAIRRDQGPS